MEGHKDFEYGAINYENRNIFVQVSEDVVKKDFIYLNLNAIFYLMKISSGLLITLNMIKKTIR